MSETAHAKNPIVENRRKIRIALNAFLLSSAAFYAAPMAHAAPPVSCASLTGLSLPNTTITLAQSYSKGQVVTGTTTAPAGLCRVAGTVKPSSGSNIHFEVWIPTDGSWNGKYEQIGNGGFAGSISVSNIANQVTRGYAAAATDDGTSGPPSGAPTFIGNPNVLIDYGYRAIKVTTDDSKAIVEALMGRGPRYSYFNGCSDGGREALQEAQRFPDDFDGIIVGSPTNDMVAEFGSSYHWDMDATLGGPQTDGVPNSYIPTSLLPVISQKALAQCVGKDGGVSTDAFLSDPRQCNFDPGSVQCKAGQDPTTCLTPAQVAAARKIYEGAHTARGELLFPGYEPGGESASGDWTSWITGSSSSSPGSQYTLGYEFSCDLVLGVTSCDYLDINIDQEFETARRTIGTTVSAINPDIQEFRRLGGKLIQYAGWADTAIAPENGLNYYRRVASELGNLDNFYRVFMVPGMAHCSGGAGANAFGNNISNNAPVMDPEHDLLKALEDWVENGVAPNQIIATKYVNDTAAEGIAFQRPLCPYPERVTYNGKGDPTQASSFRCVPYLNDSDPRNIGTQADYKTFPAPWPFFDDFPRH